MPAAPRPPARPMRSRGVAAARAAASAAAAAGGSGAGRPAAAGAAAARAPPPPGWPPRHPAPPPPRPPGPPPPPGWTPAGPPPQQQAWRPPPPPPPSSTVWTPPQQQPWARAPPPARPPPPPPPAPPPPRTPVVAVASTAVAAASSAIISPLAAPSPSSTTPPPQLPRGGVLTPSQRRSAFAAAAAAAEAAAAAAAAAPSMRDGDQRTAEWRALRDARLTASAFGNALGFWEGGRAKLWREKVGLARPFAGNAATRYGTRAEPAALAAYAAATATPVDECRFEVLLDDDAHGWLGASPDGLLRVGGDPAPTAVLEIKCPFNRGAPAAAVPWPVPPAYYMPQVQGLLAVLGERRPRAVPATMPDFCDLWCWTPVHGAAAYRIPVDRGYWAAAYEVLADFWWAHVVPARHAVAEARAEGGDVAAAAAPYQPPERHPLTDALRARSEAMAAAAAVTRYGAGQLPGVDVEGLVRG